MRIIISGGGTGGHIYPALAVAQEIIRRVPQADILYIGTTAGLENKIVPAAGIAFKTIEVTGIDRNSMLKASKSLLSFPRSFFQAWDIIKNFNPDVVLGTGGYVSFPVLLAGTFSPCKTYIHEQNALPGLANRNLARRVDCVMLTFAEAATQMETRRVVITGLPVRQDILEVNREQAWKNMKLKPGIFTMLVFGGSRGAVSINRAMLASLARFQEQEMQIIWITGHNNYNQIENEFENWNQRTLKCRLDVYPYLNNMQDALAVSDLAVCRAGAATISELAVMGTPAILIPYPYAAENHQEKNARALVNKNAAEMIIDEFLDGDTLYKKVMELKQDVKRRAEIGRNIRNEARPNALKDIVDIILEV